MDKVTLQKDYVTKTEFKSSINAIDLKLKDHSAELRDIKGTLSTLKISVMNIEAKINIYSDMYEINKWNLNKLANRVNGLEKHSGVTPPQELLISGL